MRMFRPRLCAELKPKVAATGNGATQDFLKLMFAGSRIISRVLVCYVGKSNHFLADCSRFQERRSSLTEENSGDANYWDLGWTKGDSKVGTRFIVSGGSGCGRGLVCSSLGPRRTYCPGVYCASLYCTEAESGIPTVAPSGKSCKNLPLAVYCAVMPPHPHAKGSSEVGCLIRARPRHDSEIRVPSILALLLSSLFCMNPGLPCAQLSEVIDPGAAALESDSLPLLLHIPLLFHLAHMR
ncbi:hypothetical protein Mapa_012412 [Marchantia paleacea]|nr:hypothetical protein Mapa_012412 [Marchantia paleacea]